MKVYGLDLSFTSTGVASLDGCWTIASKSEKGSTLAMRAARMIKMRDQVLAAVNDASLVVVEASIKSKLNPTDRLHGFWWSVVLGLHDEGIPTAEVNPSHLKQYATGKGGASKTAICQEVTRRLPDFAPADDDQVDALVLLAMGLDYLGRPLAQMPNKNREALEAVAWPASIERTLKR